MAETRSNTDNISEHPSKRNVCKDYVRVCFILFLGTVFSIAVFWMVLKQNIMSSQEAFAHEKALEILSLHHKIETMEQFWSDIQSFYKSSEQVEWDEFVTFMSPALKHREISFVGWSPILISGERRALFGLSRSEERAEVYRTYFDENASMQALMKDAYLSGSIAISGVFANVEDSDRALNNIALAIPTFQKQALGDGVLKQSGAVLIVLDLDLLFMPIFQREAGGNVFISLEDRAGKMRYPVFAYNEDTNFLSGFFDRFRKKTYFSLVHRTLNFGPQFLGVTASPSFASLRQGSDNIPWSVLLLGLVLTAFLAFWFYQQLSRHLSVQILVEEKTNALASSEKHIRAILDNMIEGIITIDRHGIILTYNPACEGIFGYLADEIIGRNVSILMPSGYRERHDTYIENYLKTGQAKIIGVGREMEGQRKDGSVFPMELSIGEIVGEHDLRFVGIVRDITERREFQRRLSDFMEQLQRSNQELDDFVYIVSHDLKEPLRGIYSYSHFLQEDYANKLDDDANSKLETMKKLAARMEALIDRLLYFSRLGRSDLAFRKTDLQKEVQDIIDVLVLPDEAGKFTVKIKGKLPTVVCDYARVGEVFHNLIINAIKYNDRVHKKVEIGCVLDHAAAPGKPVFYVSDNGIGIPDKHKELVFKMFKRLHARDAYGGGTGSGLTIVKKIIDRHHGKIWVESDGKRGSVFYFTLEA
ncbi:MAG: PAS domain S-box protein [Alphaproteobacteria bacterium]|nr:PAS domain S-box protein [Alphaproteobacteria bacterium]